MASAGSNTDSIPLLAGEFRWIFFLSRKTNEWFDLVRGPGAVQLVTSPAHQDEITKVKVFNVENCRLTCFSRTGHQFVIADKDKFVRRIEFLKKNIFS